MDAKQPSPAMEAFRTAVMRDPTAQQMLAEHHDPERFEALALDYAAARGIPLDAGELRASQVSSQRPAPQSGRDWPPAPWLPVRYVEGERPAIDWCHFAGQKPVQPFFSDSAGEAAVRPFNRALRYRTPLDAFVENAEAARPSGLIFHMSRCGSTLVSQMLGAAPDMVAIAEPEPFDALLRAPLPPGMRIAALRAMAAALGRGHRHYFLKTDSWHTLDLPLLAQAFPGAPWIFLYRDPIEVLASHARMPGRQTVPGMVPVLDSIATGSQGLDHAAQILARICQAAIAHGVQDHGMLVHYRELPDALFTRVLPHFRIDPSAQDRALMVRAARRDAKAPRQSFLPDGALKRREASAQAHAALRHLTPVYAELEAIRAASLPAAV